MAILWWLAPTAAVALAGVLAVTWANRRRAATDRRAEPLDVSEIERMGKALARPLPRNRRAVRRPRTRGTGLARLTRSID
ncbi:MAG: hypothetical protein ACRCYQ_06485 [Nocardioides sp.]